MRLVSHKKRAGRSYIHPRPGGKVRAAQFSSARRGGIDRRGGRRSPVRAAPYGGRSRKRRAPFAPVAPIRRSSVTRSPERARHPAKRRPSSAFSRLHSPSRAARAKEGSVRRQWRKTNIRGYPLIPIDGTCFGESCVRSKVKPSNLFYKAKVELCFKYEVRRLLTNFINDCRRLGKELSRAIRCYPARVEANCGIDDVNARSRMLCIDWSGCMCWVRLDRDRGILRFHVTRPLRNASLPYSAVRRRLCSLVTHRVRPCLSLNLYEREREDIEESFQAFA